MGDWSQQWLNLRYVVRLLVRLGADADSVALHGSLVAVGRPSPLDERSMISVSEPAAGQGPSVVPKR